MYVSLKFDLGHFHLAQDSLIKIRYLEIHENYGQFTSLLPNYYVRLFVFTHVLNSTLVTEG